MSNRYAFVSGTALAAVIGIGALAVTASADSPNNSAQGAFTAVTSLGANAHIAFSATSDPAFQATHGTSGSADGMMNFEPNAQSLRVEPAVGRVGVSCLNVVNGNEAIMTGTVSDPISTNAFTGPPLNAPPNEWIVGAALVVIANGGTAPDQISFGYFVNPDKNHVISTPRCFGSGLVGGLRAVEQGHINVYGVAP